jgi:hypothetical protein
MHMHMHMYMYVPMCVCACVTEVAVLRACSPRTTHHAPRTTHHAPLQVAVLRAERIKHVRCNPAQWALYEAARVVRAPC